MKTDLKKRRIVKPVMMNNLYIVLAVMAVRLNLERIPMV